MELRTRDLGETTVGYHVAGAGTPVVLLHGLGESGSGWRWVMPALAGSHRVYALDLPGLGTTAHHRDDYSPETLARTILAFCDAEGIDAATVAGNSLGGQTAVHLALAAPERVWGLVLLAASGLGAEITSLLRLPTLPGVGESMAAWGRTPPGAAQRATGRAALLFGSRRRVPGSWLAEQYRLARQPAFLPANIAALRAQVTPRRQRQVLRDRLPAVQAPTLVLWGTRDRVLPLRHGRDAADVLARARFERLEGVGHAPQLEVPARVAGAISHLVASVT